MTDIDEEGKSKQQDLMTRALAEIKRLRRENDKFRRRREEPIAVVGMGCRFPGGADNVEKFWSLLEEGYDGISDVPADRWDKSHLVDANPEAPGKTCTARGGFISDGLAFDAGFFGISPLEAKSLDPQQGLLLEVVWQALEQGNINPRSLYNTRTGVFIGASSPDNAMQLMGGPLENVDAYHGSGCAFGPLAGRVSFYFGFLGPSFVVDTACSSSLVSLHLAAESLRRGECDSAVAGGVQLNTHPGFPVTFSKANMLSPDGRCKTFDEAADGYVRGEGCGILILKRLEDAQAAGDKILALFRGSAVNQDGPSGGLTVPSGPAQVRVVREALANAGLSPKEVSFIEAHGTGTALGDPIEVGALGEVFSKERSPDKPLLIGSLKTNIGHLEAAAGVAGAIKTILSLQKRRLPPHKNLTSLNPLIAWDELPIEVAIGSPVELDQTGELCAGVSSFGFSGTNAHAVFSTAVAGSVPEAVDAESAPPTLVLSARSEAALESLAAEYSQLFSDPLESHHLLTAACWHSRAQHNHRLAIVGQTSKSIGEQLSRIRQAEGSTGIFKGVTSGSPRKLAFVFSGQGSQYAGMGMKLYADNLVFRKAFDFCAEIVADLGGGRVTDLLREKTELIHNTENAQVAIFCLQYSLCELWRHCGIAPAAVVGHSVGEIAAAFASGMLTLEDAAQLSVFRARAMGEVPQAGGMLAVALSEKRVAEYLDQKTEVIAGINGPNSTVISGPSSRLELLETRLTSIGARVKKLRVSHAFHSPAFSEAANHLAERIQHLDFRKPKLPIALNLYGRADTDTKLNPAYWSEQMISPVRFEGCISDLNTLEIGHWVEVGAHPTLLPAVREITEGDISNDSETVGRYVPTLKQGTCDSQTFQQACARLWVTNQSIQFHFPPYRNLTLPAYPFQRRVYRRKRLDTVTSLESTKIASRRWTEHVVSNRIGVEIFQRLLSVNELPELDDHHVFGSRVVAGAFHLALITEALSQSARSGRIELHNLIFPQALVLREATSISIQATIDTSSDGTAVVELANCATESEKQQLHIRANLDDTLNPKKDQLKFISESSMEELAPEKIYSAQARRQINVGESYHWLKTVKVAEREGYACISRPEAKAIGVDWLLPPGLVDSCFGIFIYVSGVAEDETFVPVAFDRVTYESLDFPKELHARVRVDKTDFKAGEVRGDIQIEDTAGRPVLILEGVTARRTTRNLLLGETLVDGEDFLNIDWREVELPVEDACSGPWLVVAEQEDIVQDLAIALRQKGGVVECIQVDEIERWGANPQHAPQLIREQLLSRLPPGNDKWRGVIHYLSTDLYCEETRSSTDLYHACGSVLHGIQALSDDGPVSSYTVLSRRAVRTSANDPVINPMQATAWGLIRSVIRERPELAIRIIDIDHENATHQISEVVRALTAPTKEKQLALRSQKYLVPRVVKAQQSAGSGLSIKADHAYVLIGGHGGIGLAVCHWLIERGARKFVIIGRRGLQNSETTNFLENHAPDGVEVTKLSFPDNGQFDFTDLDLTTVGAPLGGVFHLAGVLADSVLQNMSWEMFEKVLPSKIYVGRTLASFAVEHPDVPIILFSSLASVLGSPGQSNYAAANAFLDALGDSAQPNITTISWGPWQGLGMTDQMTSESRQQLVANGIDFLEPRTAMSAFDTLDFVQGGHSTIALVNWRRWKDQGLMFSELVAPTKAEVTEGQLLSDLKAQRSDQRFGALIERLRTLVATALHLEPSEIGARVGLFDIGVDSLTGMQLKSELQKDLGVPLGSTLLFDYPTLEKLAEFLIAEYIADSEGVSHSAENSAPIETSSQGRAEIEAALNRLKATLK